jgi:hypothetical protein
MYTVCFGAAIMFSWSTYIIRVRHILLVWLIVHILVSQSFVVLVRFRGELGYL